jgi:hypothetical protein
MKNEELEVITNSIKETLGEESTALIADSLGLLMSENTRVYNSIVAKDKEIDQLKEKNDRLVNANANLLQRVPIAAPELKVVKEEPKKVTSLKDCFDKNGNFLR